MVVTQPGTAAASLLAMANVKAASAKSGFSNEELGTAIAAADAIPVVSKRIAIVFLTMWCMFDRETPGAHDNEVALQKV